MTGVTDGPDAHTPDEPHAPDAPSAPDGRSARSQRTRDAVVEALLAWLRDGNLRPTAKEIADRAGISVRSVYVHFDDLEDLFCAAATHQLSDLAHLVREVPATGSFEDRLTAFVVQRTRVFEAVMPVRRAATLQEPFSPTLAQLLDVTRRFARDEIRRVFAAELQRGGAGEGGRAVLAADALASAESWDHLRRHAGCSADEAGAVITAGLRAILAPAPPDPSLEGPVEGRSQDHAR